MALHVFWPALTCLTLFIIGVIIVMLRHGPRLCRLRHTAFTDENEEFRDAAYEQPVSYA